MGLFDNIKEPKVLKAGHKAKEQLVAMEELLKTATHPKLVTALESDIAAMRAGVFGEDTILFELKNSHMPLCVMHDLYLEHEGLSAQIDFLIVTRKRTFVLECKNLYGNITVNQAGDFVRQVGSRREGLYSPVTQSQRHLELLKKIRADDKGNMLTKMLFENAFDSNYKSVVVLANQRTVLNARYAPKMVREQVIRADQLIEYIKKSNAQRDAVDHGEKQMLELAEYYLAKHSEPKVDYLERYRKLAETVEGVGVIGTEVATVGALPCSVGATKPHEMLQDVPPNCPVCGNVMIRRTASKGANVGKEFWGCSRFPKCRGVMNIGV